MNLALNGRSTPNSVEMLDSIIFRSTIIKIIAAVINTAFLIDIKPLKCIATFRCKADLHADMHGCDIHMQYPELGNYISAQQNKFICADFYN